MMEFDTFIPELKKIQQMKISRETPFKFFWNQKMENSLFYAMISENNIK